ncbi:2,3-diphosphoglycerate-dependent phosphoglycerate mutase [Sphingomonas oligophenolica]|uniref:2,3-bisphosphoglycerate-dependent phosphoglycerate mutase n=1 Tax=Sphingomonas oligophenolica TaxID=301154 RepID=A0ABU9Y673_9SPHN
MPVLVLLRHGQAAWNLDDRFAGWWDVDLTPQGVAEAVAAGALLEKKGFEFDFCFASVQTRAIRTLNLALEVMQQDWLPIEKNWHLNERHYGALTGLTKAEATLKHGNDRMQTWLRSFDIAPPPLADPELDLARDRRYAGVPLPDAECLSDTTDRVIRYWNARIAPELRADKNVLVSAHGNSVGALVRHLSNLTPSEIAALGVPAGEPIVFELDEDLTPIHRYSLSQEC